MSEPKVVKVLIHNNKTGECTPNKACIVTEPGMTTNWNFSLPFSSDDIAVRIAWPICEVLP